MNRLSSLWSSNTGRAALIGVPVLLLCIAGVVQSSRRPRQETAAQPTATALPTAPPEPTQSPPTAASPTLTVVPVPTQSADERYLQIAQQGALPVVRSGAPKGAWAATAHDLGQGPEAQVVFPMTIGFSNEQTVRQAKLQGAGIIKRLFDADAALARINVIGTLPDGSNSAELPAISIVVERATYAAWDGKAESLNWHVSPRLR